MYEIEPNFFNPDYSLNSDAACAAGCKQQARLAAQGAREMEESAKRFASKHNHQLSTLLPLTRYVGQNSLD